MHCRAMLHNRQLLLPPRRKGLASPSSSHSRASTAGGCSTCTPPALMSGLCVEGQPSRRIRLHGSLAAMHGLASGSGAMAGGGGKQHSVQ